MSVILFAPKTSENMRRNEAFFKPTKMREKPIEVGGKPFVVEHLSNGLFLVVIPKDDARVRDNLSRGNGVFSIDDDFKEPFFFLGRTNYSNAGNSLEAARPRSRDSSFRIIGDAPIPSDELFSLRMSWYDSSDKYDFERMGGQDMPYLHSPLGFVAKIIDGESVRVCFSVSGEVTHFRSFEQRFLPPTPIGDLQFEGFDPKMQVVDMAATTRAMIIQGVPEGIRALIGLEF